MSSGAVRAPLNRAEDGPVLCNEDAKEVVDDALSLW